MQNPQFKECMEQEMARLEGADQALNELMGLKPSPETQKKSEQVGEKLDGLRQKAAEKERLEAVRLWRQGWKLLRDSSGRSGFARG